MSGDDPEPVGCVSHGSPPKQLKLNDVETMRFEIHNFESIENERDEYILTTAILAHGYPWKLWVDPRGNPLSSNDVEHVSVYLLYDGDAKDKLAAKYSIRCKAYCRTTKIQTFDDTNPSWGYTDYLKRNAVLERYLDEDGTLVLDVDIQLAVEKATAGSSSRPTQPNTNMNMNVNTNVNTNPNVTEQQHRESVLAAVKNNGLALQDASNVLKGDREIVFAAVNQNGYALQYASNVLKGDRDIVYAAMKQDSVALQFASNVLQRDKDFVMEAMAQNGMALKFVSETLKCDNEIVKAAVTNNGMALQYASLEPRDDINIVLAAIRNNGAALQYASTKMQNNNVIQSDALAQIDLDRIQRERR